MKHPGGNVKLRIIWLAALLCACGAPEPVDMSGPVADWPEYGGDKGGLRWSPLDQISAVNVNRLEVAWTHHHGDIALPSEEESRTSFNATPLMVGDTLYFCTGANRVFALDAETGVERWVFDPVQRNRKLDGPYPRSCRGVAHWAEPNAAPGVCRERIFNGTIDGASVHPREVLVAGLKKNAAAAILVHNHPSGNPSPSDADKAITSRLKDALALVDIRVLDHLIVAGTNTASFAEQGLI